MSEEARSLHLKGATGEYRTERFDGRDHLVVPVVALIGDNVIHAVNSAAPEWVPVATLAEAPHQWNGRPLVLGHPAKDGIQISANDPKVLERQAFGFMASSHLKDKRLGTEAWIDPVKLEAIGGAKMLERIRNNEPIEVSVGAFVRTNARAGVAPNGKTYKHEWASLAADHLAFLPDTKGACSIEMGCGSARHAMLVTAEGLVEVDEDPIDTDALKDLGGPGSGNFGHGSYGKHSEAEKAHREAAEAHREAAESHAPAFPAASAKKASESATKATKETGAKPFSASAAKTYDKMAFTAKDPGKAKTYHQMAAKYHDAAARDHSVAKGSKKKMKGAEMKRSLPERLAALVAGFRSAVDTPSQAASEECAELIAYKAMRELTDQAGSSWDAMSALIDDLIADEEENPAETPEDEDAEEEVEQARCEAIQTLCSAMIGQLSSVMNITYKQLIPDLPETSDPRYAEAVEELYTAAGLRDAEGHLTTEEKLRAAIGKKISASNLKVVQDTHDTLHASHASVVKLGAACNGMKLLEEKTPCGCLKAAEEGGDTVNKELRTATITALLASADSGFTKADEPMLNAMTDERLEGLEATSKAGIKTLAGTKADAEKIIADHHKATTALGEHATMLAAAAKKKEDAAGDNKDGEDKDKKDMKAAEEAEAARLTAAKAAGFETVEAHEQDVFYKKNPEIKALVDGEKARKIARKDELVAGLKAASSALTEDQLKAKSVEELETLALFAKIEPVDYSGRGVAVPRTAASKDDVYLNPPNPYAPGLEKMRAAEAARK